MSLEDLHVEPVVASEAKADDLAIQIRGLGLPAGEAITHRQRLVDGVRRRRADTDHVQDIRHLQCILLFLGVPIVQAG
jgi:hypothetical protein